MRVICNRCGKEIKTEKEEYLQVEKHWGYFSKKDGMTMSFDLCEACLEEITKDFLLPAVLRERTELI